jgi:hypothetical protein
LTTKIELFHRDSVLMDPEGCMKQIWTACICVIALRAASFGAQPDWAALQSLHPDARISVVLQDGKFLQGRFAAWAPESIEVASGRGIRTLHAAEVRRVSLQQKSSRWKGVMFGALIGFGIAFPIGAASAGHLTDRNNPGFATRAGMGAGLGMFGAAIGAPIGAFTSGTKNVTLYDAHVSSAKEQR